MPELNRDDEQRLESVQWLQGARLRGVQVDAQRRDVSVFALTGELLVELLCEDVGYLALPNLFDLAQMPRIVGLVAQPLEQAFAVRVEFSNHPSQIHLQCQRLVVRKEAA
ncbi:MAG: hypothetical protein HY901_23185 [Deltaproteobacteria bacterium]|nr:hypothetical protein [Deltaproteobacteria bacterium]